MPRTGLEADRGVPSGNVRHRTLHPPSCHAFCGLCARHAENDLLPVKSASPDTSHNPAACDDGAGHDRSYGKGKGHPGRGQRGHAQPFARSSTQEVRIVRRQDLHGRRSRGMPLLPEYAHEEHRLRNRRRSRRPCVRISCTFVTIRPKARQTAFRSVCQSFSMHIRLQDKPEQYEHEHDANY